MEKIKGRTIIAITEDVDIIELMNVNGVDIFYVYKFIFENMGASDCHIVINGGEEILIEANETIELPNNFQVFSCVVKEKNSKVRYLCAMQP